MAESPRGGEPAAPVLLAGGRVLGGFAYTSVGDRGWSVAAHDDVAGLSSDAIGEGRGLIERLEWWSDPATPIVTGIDVYLRPRRLAWLARGSATRRFLIHTVYAERDASDRPGNCYSECLVLARPAAGEAAREQAVPGDGPTLLRPSQLWDPDRWSTPWGAREVAAARPSRGWALPPTSAARILAKIAEDPTGPAELRRMLRAAHDTLHRTDRLPLVAVVDDLIWAAGLLDTALSLLPEEDLWDATFDLRSIAPRAGPGMPPGSGLVADVNLFGPEFPQADRPPQTLDLTAAASAGADPGSPEISPDCGFCNRWFATIDAVLGEPMGLDPQRLADVLADVRNAHARHRTVTPRPERDPLPDPVRGSASFSGRAPALAGPEDPLGWPTSPRPASHFIDTRPAAPQPQGPRRSGRGGRDLDAPAAQPPTLLDPPSTEAPGPVGRPEHWRPESPASEQSAADHRAAEHGAGGQRAAEHGAAEHGAGQPWSAEPGVPERRRPGSMTQPPFPDQPPVAGSDWSNAGAQPPGSSGSWGAGETGAAPVALPPHQSHSGSVPPASPSPSAGMTGPRGYHGVRGPDRDATDKPPTDPGFGASMQQGGPRPSGTPGTGGGPSSVPRGETLAPPPGPRSDPEAVRMRALIELIATAVVDLEDGLAPEPHRRQKAMRAWERIVKAASLESARIRQELGLPEQPGQSGSGSRGRSGQRRK